MGESRIPLMLVGMTVGIIGGAIYAAYFFRTTDAGPMHFFIILGVLAFVGMVFAVFKAMTK